MVAVIQRVLSASVTADGVETGRCGRGMMILLGVSTGDGEAEARMLAQKVSKLRIFSDGEGKMNLSAPDVGGGALVVSNFTLLADCRRGNRPDFFGAAPPDEAERLYDMFCSALEENMPVQRGVFGADMRIDLTADGPVTIILDTADLNRPRRSAQ